MKKNNIAIVTLTGTSNYGNRLQNYALEKVLRRYADNVVTIDNDYIYANFFKILKYRLKQLFYFFKNIVIKSERIRKSNFLEFNKNIKFTNRIVRSRFETKKIKNDFDYFVIGSDQIWNPYYKRDYFLDFCMFANKNILSYAASFGVSDIPKNKINDYVRGLNNINYISVREDRGKEIIEDLVGRSDVEVLVDPTMLLTADEWDFVSKKPTMLNSDKYILVYFLGNISESIFKEINRVALENNCEIINLLDVNSPFYTCGPSEFLYLEKNAFLICTDSFHSSVFAILYDRPFIIFDREQSGMKKMNSRLDTLINKFKIKNRKYNGYIISSENLKHDYTDAYRILNYEREKSLCFLKQSLDIEECE